MKLGELLKKIEHHRECAALCWKTANSASSVFQFKSGVRYRSEALGHEAKANKLTALLDRIQVLEQVGQEVEAEELGGMELGA